MNTDRLSRPLFYDFQRITREDLESEQNFQLANSAAGVDAIAGSGVLLAFPTEPIIFDSDNLDAFQDGLVAINSFDGQGILTTPYQATDLVGGVQVAAALSNSRIGGVVRTSVALIGKLFDHTLVYEILHFNANTVVTSKNHFIEITNILLQNFRGNTNTTVDGYGCYDIGGRLILSEAGSMRPDRDAISNQQVLEPDITLANFKTAVAGKTLSNTIKEAIGSSNNIDDLNINTTAANTRLFSSGAATDIIYAQKIILSSNNIQKISTLLSLAADGNWSGSL